MPIKRPIFLYSVLAALFLITVAYQARYLPDFIHRDSKQTPFFFVDTGSDRISFATPEARQFGVHSGDRLIAVEGMPFTGTALLARAFQDVQVGVPFRVTILPKGAPAGKEQQVSLPVTASHFFSWDSASDIIVSILLPGISLLLGFWVAARRPRDPLAWLLLLLMVSFPHVLQSYIVNSWPPGWRVAGMLYETILETCFPVVIYFFGRFFPEPFAPGSRYDRGYRAMLWLCVIPFVAISCLGIVISIGSLDNYQSIAALRAFYSHFDILEQILAYVLISSFFAAMGIKLGETKTADAKRRLRFLYWGATAAFLPALLPTLVARLIGKSPNDIFPSWVLGLILFPLLLFPLTLSYVIVVQKAMGVGVALRQGVQYTFARRGVRVLQGLSMWAVIIAATTIAANARQELAKKIIVLVIGIAAYFTIRRVGDGLRTWIDRRFFRENYNAENLLAELSEQVRTMTEPASLLETVAARISETLHVQQIAIFLSGGGVYRPSFAMGYPVVPAVAFPSKTGTAEVLRNEREPARVFLNDRDSWVYREEGVSDEERQQLATLQSELLLPLAVREKLLGFISLGSKRSEEPYTGSDVRLLKSVATQTGLALENANLMQTVADEVAQRERLNREVEIAREVQERLFPQKLPPIRGLDYAGHCRPALGVGGDYYDFLALPQGSLGVAIGDVSGKGIAAALMMASLQASLRSEATRNSEDLAAAVASINRLVFEASSSNRYATFFYGQYDPATNRFAYVNAGHNSPMLFHCSGGQWSVTRLDPGGTVVGLLENANYQQGSVTLSPGDVLIAYTDGISEAMDLQDEEWGEDRLMDSVRQSLTAANAAAQSNGAASPAQHLLKELFAAATQFAGTAPQHDDMTLVVLRAFSA